MHAGSYACWFICMLVHMHAGSYACWFICMLVHMHAGGVHYFPLPVHLHCVIQMYAGTFLYSILKCIVDFIYFFSHPIAYRHYGNAHFLWL